MKNLTYMLTLSLTLSLPLIARAQQATPDVSQSISAGAATAAPYTELVTMFDYDHTTPLNVKVVGTTERDGVTVEDITYDRLGGGDPVQAFLVLPKGDGPFPAVLYAHWYEPSSPLSNRTQFLDEAVTMAQDGLASLLISTNWSEPNWFQSGRSLASDYDDSVAQVKELRRALDVLEAQPKVDGDRLGYVGHDFGAMYGGVLSGVDPRVRIYVLIAGTKSFSDWFLLGTHLTDAEQRSFIDRMAPLDPTTYVAHAAPAYVYFQFGSQDPYVPEDGATAFFEAASQASSMTRYEAGHEMDLPEIRAARIGILEARLAFGAGASS